jgi:hypothetical protein
MTRFFKEKWVTFYRVCLSILAFLQPQILKIDDLSDFFEIMRQLRMDQDFIEYEDRNYVNSPSIVETLIKWREIIKRSDTDYPDISKHILSIQNN